jgi:hypothetical protein
MRQYDRGSSPTEPVLLQSQPREGRRDRSEWIKRAEEVVAKTGNGQLAGADCSTGFKFGFEEKNIPARIREHIGGHQSIGTCSNDNGVDDHYSARRTSSSRRRRASPFLIWIAGSKSRRAIRAMNGAEGPSVIVTSVPGGEAARLSSMWADPIGRTLASNTSLRGRSLSRTVVSSRRRNGHTPTV